MAVFKCKMCGGALEVQPEQTTAVCGYCGTQQTLPRLDSDRRANLYDRASHYRRNNEYDKAAALYEQLLNEDAADAEAYWSLVLCRYGVEYVEDPATHARIPTINRTQFTSVFDDENYRSALAHAGVGQRAIYEREAEAINRIQKGILEISEREAPFDVFLCYKETDANGRRTPDSVLAGDLYRELTQEGFRVFFARVTLEDKLGTAYEPYIFSALQSARVMVVLGTRPDHFNAVWVKNEWSRYLALIRGGAKKTLIPAYRDMDPYDLPEEFSHLQALDMGRLGFMQDLVHGIRKLTGAPQPMAGSAPQPAAPQAAPQAAPVPAAAPLLRRAFLFLEDGDWTSADEYCERVLDLEPENAEAYLGKLMAELRCSRREALRACQAPFDGSDNYQKALRFGGAALKEELSDAAKTVREREAQRRLQARYEAAARRLQEPCTPEAYREAAAAFAHISGYRDADARAQDCLRRAEELEQRRAAEQAQRLRTQKRLRRTAIIALPAALALLVISIVLMPVISYRQAEKLLEAGRYEEAAAAFAELDDYADAAERALACRYVGAEALLEAEQYDEAAAAFAALGDYEDSAERALACRYAKAEVLLEAGQYDEAAAAFAELDEHADSAERALACRYAKAEVLLEAGRYEEAAAAFAELDDYADATERSQSLFYQQAESLLEAGRYEEAAAAFAELDDYADATERSQSLFYQQAESLLEAGRTPEAAIAFGRADGYRDARARSAALWAGVAQRDAVAAGWNYTIGLRADGTVVATGFNKYGQCDVSGWRDLVAVAAGGYHTVGLCADGTAVATGDNEYGQCDVSGWQDLVAVAADYDHTVGLRADGTVVATGDNSDGQCDVSDWQEIVAVAAGLFHTVGLRADGTAVATGYNEYGRCDVSGWQGIVAVAAGDDHTVGLRADGTVVATGYNEYGRCDVSGWHDLVAVAAGGLHTVGLRADGTAVATGDNEYGQCDVSGWQDLVAIAAGRLHTVGLRADGTAIATGWSPPGGRDVSGWQDLVAVAAGDDHTVGLRADGTVVATGDNFHGQCDVSDWRDLLTPAA